MAGMAPKVQTQAVPSSVHSVATVWVMRSRYRFIRSSSPKSRRGGDRGGASMDMRCSPNRSSLRKLDHPRYTASRGLDARGCASITGRNGLHHLRLPLPDPHDENRTARLPILEGEAACDRFEDLGLRQLVP